MVYSYKYLGCVVDEFLELKEMVEDKAKAGRRALGARFQRCRAEMGDVTVGIFRKLMEPLVESTMMNGAELWVCSWHLVSIEQVRLRALRMLFGVGTLHPKQGRLSNFPVGGASMIIALVRRVVRYGHACIAV